MQRRNVVIAVGALVVLGLGGFGAGRLLLAKPTANATLIAKPSTCDDAFRVLKLAPSMITAARPVCLVQSLVLSGELHGSVGQAYPVESDGVAATSLCTTPIGVGASADSNSRVADLTPEHAEHMAHGGQNSRITSRLRR